MKSHLSLTCTAALAVAVGAARAAAEPFQPLSVRRPPAADAQVLAGIDQRIHEHRTARVRLALSGPDGQPLAAGTRVHVEQVRHAFHFGVAANFLSRGAKAPEAVRQEYCQRLLAVFNSVTVPFYWHHYEAKEGTRLEQPRRALMEWARGHGLWVKGHPLLWTHEPAWVGQLPKDQWLGRLFGRVSRDASAFAGLADAWDVVNEPCCGIDQGNQRQAVAAVEAYRQLGTAGVVERAFRAARQADTRALLALNDWDISPRFSDLVRECLAAGTPIDVIGLQSHMHDAYWQPAAVWEICERFGALGKPVHFTELTILSGTEKGAATSAAGEALQAQRVEELYRLLYSHPAVAAIVWWDLTDLNAWQGAPAGLVRADMTPKPAYERVQGLVKGAWWTRADLAVGAGGVVHVEGHIGTLEVGVTLDGQVARGQFELTRGEAERPVLPVKLKVAVPGQAPPVLAPEPSRRPQGQKPSATPPPPS